MFSLWMAKNYVNHQKKFYLLFCIQIIIITVIVSLLLGLRTGFNQEVIQMSNQRQYDVIYFTNQNEINVYSQHDNFSLEDYSTLHTQFPNVTMSWAKKWNIGLLDNHAKVKNYQYYEIAGDFEALALSETVHLDLDQYIYASHQFFEDLENALVLQPDYTTFQGFDIKSIEVDEGWLELHSGEKIAIFPFEKLSNPEDVTVVFGSFINLTNLKEETDYLMDTVIVHSKWQLLNEALSPTSLGIKINQEERHTLKEILSFLQEKFPTTMITYFSIEQLLNEKRDEITLMSRSGMVISLVCGMIVFIGLIGLVSTFIDRRKSNIALSYLLGATSHNLILELFLELCLIVTSSGIIGIVISYIITLFNQQMLGFPVKLSLFNSLMLLFTQFLLTTFVTLVLAKKYLAMDSISILNEV